MQKITLMFVEGLSDKVSFESYLEALKPSSSKIEVCNGDWFRDYDKDELQYSEMLKNGVDTFLSNNSEYQIDDIEEIIHVIDLDGAFVDDSCISFKKGVKKREFTPSCIFTNNVKEELDGLHYRKDRIYDALNLDIFAYDLSKKIRFRMFYMSCNLECALYGSYLNYTDEQKADLSDEFSTKFSKIDDFVTFMESKNKSQTEDYKKSWDFVKNGLNSLLDTTNLIIFIKDFGKNNRQ